MHERNHFPTRVTWQMLFGQGGEIHHLRLDVL
jgi:hypothetical protein